MDAKKDRRRSHLWIITADGAEHRPVSSGDANDHSPRWSPNGKRLIYLSPERPMNEPEYIDPSQLRPGPVRHGSLPPELLDQIKAVYDVIGKYLSMTLEQFEIGFMRDMHPGDEVALWCSITAAWLAYHKKFLHDKELPDEEEKKLLGALIAISTGVEDLSKIGVPAEVGRRLLQCYDDRSKE